MKKLLKAILATGLTLSCTCVAFNAATTSVYAQELFPGEGYNVIPSESKVFKSNDEALKYCQAHSWDLYSRLGKEIQYQVIYLGQGQFQATFYAYNYKEGDLAPVNPVMCVKVNVDELNVRKDSTVNSEKVNWGPLSKGMIVDIYDSKRDEKQVVWHLIKVNGQEGWISSEYTVWEQAYNATQDTKPDANEKAFAKDRVKLDKETRVFIDNASAVNYATNYGVTISNRNGGQLLYYYVSYAGPENFVIHFYVDK